MPQEDFLEQAVTPSARNFMYAVSRDYFKSGGYADCEDIVQNAYLSLLTTQKEYRTKKEFRNLLAQIVRRRCVDQIRRSSAHPIVSLDAYVSEFYTEARLYVTRMKERKTDVLCVRDTGLEAIDVQEDQTKLLKKIGKLPNKMQDVVLLDGAGFSYPQIAQILSIPRGTVQSRVYTARKLLAAG